MAALPNYVPSPMLRTSLDDFRDMINRQHKLDLGSYADLHKFSIHRRNEFWLALWKFVDVKSSKYPSRAVDEDATIDQIPEFFADSRLNFAENMLAKGKDGVAVIEMNENNLSQPKQYTWQDLRELVRLYATALKGSGLKKGQIVTVIGSNCACSLALLLATAAIGGIFASLAVETGAKALDERLQLLNPDLLFVASAYQYNGKRHDISSSLEASIKKLQRAANTRVVSIGQGSDLNNLGITFDDFLSCAGSQELVFEQLPFTTPLVIMFSSGTTGRPKGIVHSHGGLVVNGLKEYLLHNNIGSEDLIYQYTNVGWTLWNISVHALLVGASIVLYDGSPFYPSPESFLNSLFKFRITSFGAGPRYYAELRRLNIKPKQLTRSLHSIVSTGAVLTPPLAEWIAQAFGPVCQISMSGGTEICGSFMHGTRSLPSYPGELAVKGLGMDVTVFSAEGIELPDGESGELVCRKPFPNMPVMFLNDPERKLYFASYFETFPHVWRHGDFIRVNPRTKGLYVLGRSDGVLNPSGVRFGSSEIYNTLQMPKFSGLITDAIVAGQQRLAAPYQDSAERVVLFIKCSPSASTGTLRVNTKLENAIREQISQDLSRRHVPSFIFETDVVPHNANGKKLEIQLKAILCKGADAMRHLKLTQAELEQLRWYVRFHDIEKVVESIGGASTKPKL